MIASDVDRSVSESFSDTQHATAEMSSPSARNSTPATRTTSSNHFPGCKRCNPIAVHRKMSTCVVTLPRLQKTNSDWFAGMFSCQFFPVRPVDRLLNAHMTPIYTVSVEQTVVPSCFLMCCNKRLKSCSWNCIWCWDLEFRLSVFWHNLTRHPCHQRRLKTMICCLACLCHALNKPNHVYPASHSKNNVELPDV